MPNNELPSNLLDSKEIFTLSPQGILILGEEGIIAQANQAAAKMFGFPLEELTGERIQTLIPTFAPHQINSLEQEMGAVRKDESDFPISLIIRKIHLENKQIHVCYIQDYTQIKEHESALADSQSKLKAVFETAVDGIIIINAEGIIEMTNLAIARLFGYSKEELIGQNISILMGNPHKAKHDQYIRTYLQSGHAKIVGIGREVLGRKKEGREFPIRLSVSEIRQDEKILFTGIIHDLSDQKKTEHAIRQLNEDLEAMVEQRTEELSQTVSKLLEVNHQLEHQIKERKRIAEALRQSEQEIRNSLEKEKELSELKSRFVSMASHEFRTPLSTIQSSAALIGRYTEAGQQNQRIKHVNRIKSAVDNLTNILNDFLSLSKIEEGKIQLRPNYFSLEGLISEVVDEMEGLLKKGQRIEVNGTDTLPTIYSDRNLLKNILFNLLSNAYKYSGEDSRILCSYQIKADKQFEIQITDQGIGIPIHEQQYLFTRFFRASNATNFKGTGLGLHIVKGYVDMLEGQISFHSNESSGSKFTVTIPYYPTGSIKAN